MSDPANSGLRLDGRGAVVTGGAAGIGMAVVRKLAAAGASVVFADINEMAGRAFAQDLSSIGQDVHYFACDVTDEPSVERLVDAARALTGQLDIGVNNVGGFHPGDLDGNQIFDTKLEAWTGTVNLNLTSCFLCMKHQLRVMLEQRRGSIVNIASLAGIRFTPGSSPAYSAAKAAIVHLTEYAAVAHAAAGVRVNAVAPGLTETRAVIDHMPEEKRAELAVVRHPMNCLIRPEEIADAVLWASSEAATAVTGITIPVDGGWAAK